MGITKRNLKRILSGLMALTMCFSLASCSIGGGEQEAKVKTTKDTRPENIEPEAKEVTETLGDFDISDYIIETNVDPDFRVDFEAEDGTLTKTAEILDNTWFGEYSGSGYVGGLNSIATTLEFTVDFPSDGIYNVELRACGDVVGKQGAVSIDNQIVCFFEITDNEAFADYVAENITVSAGSHVVGIRYYTTPVYVDKVSITPAEVIDPSTYDVCDELSNPNASDSTKRLYSFLKDTYGNYIISGNYASENGGGSGGVISREFKEINRNVGDYPAIMGLDYINLSPSAVANGSSSNVNFYAMEWDQMGGIVSLCWHWYAPEDYLEVNNNPWWKGFYTEATSFDLAAALDGSDPEGYDLLIRDIDAIAESLKELEAADIPILWRPLHEAAGDPEYENAWFWWGASGGEAYKELWILMYDRLTNYHQINNLIWVWNAQSVDWYPGDEYVDIIGYDIYAPGGNTTSQKDTYDYIKAASGERKIVALTENGVIPDPDLCMNDGTRWSWFSTWSGEFTLSEGQLSGEYTPLEMWQKVYSHERVLTLSELPDLKSYPIDTEEYLASQGS